MHNRNRLAALVETEKDEMCTFVAVHNLAGEACLLPQPTKTELD